MRDLAVLFLHLLATVARLAGGRSTIARILKAQGIPPVPERPTSWQTFLRAHWGAIAGADFFTTEVWTWRGLVTYYTVFVGSGKAGLAVERMKSVKCLGIVV
jgi:hypothetical protein